jgi:hydroxypyruvate isomerase
VPRFSANLTLLFTEVPFLERFEQARAAGFSAIEYMFPYEHDIGRIAGELARLGLRQVLFNLPAGDWQRGDRGIAVHPGRRQEFRDGVRLAADAAGRLGCRLVNCLVGLRDGALRHEEQWECMVDNLRFAARALGEAGCTLLVEPVNTYDIPGFFLSRSSEAVRALDEIGAPNVRLQYDVYHMQRMEGNIVPALRALLPRIGHVQIADPPDRHQPGTGELNFAYILRSLDAAGYEGHVGLEYRPLGSTRESLAWIGAMGLTLG